MSSGVLYACQGTLVDARGRVLVQHRPSPGLSLVIYQGTPYAPLVEMQEKTAIFSLLCRNILQQLPKSTIARLRKADRDVLRDYWEEAREICQGVRMHK
jgi:hypothetical protein